MTDPAPSTPAEPLPFDPDRWADAIAAWITRDPTRLLRRAIVLSEVGSTQDEADRASADGPGVLVVADRQLAGRGRLGRSWVQSAGTGLPVSIALDAARHHPGRLSIAAGLAVADAAQRVLHAAGIETPIGLRWPNDAIEPAPGTRKLAGVLIEARPQRLILGIGINTHQTHADFPPDLRPHAVSLATLTRAPVHRLDLLLALLDALRHALALNDLDLVRRWTARDVLVGTRRAFLHDRQRIEGLVEHIDPLNDITIRLDDGSRRSLPALTTTLVKP